MLRGITDEAMVQLACCLPAEMRGDYVCADDSTLKTEWIALLWFPGIELARGRGKRDGDLQTTQRSEHSARIRAQAGAVSLTRRRFPIARWALTPQPCGGKSIRSADASRDTPLLHSHSEHRTYRSGGNTHLARLFAAPRN